MIKWSEKFSVSNGQIDNQHKKILEELNNIIRLIGLNKSVHDIKLASDMLEDVVKTHFITEERLMKMNNYPDMKKHLKEHRIFEKNIQLLKKALIQYGISDRLKEMIHTEIMEWNNKHIMEFDMKLGIFLKSKNNM